MFCALSHTVVFLAIFSAISFADDHGISSAPSSTPVFWEVLREPLKQIGTAVVDFYTVPELDSPYLERLAPLSQNERFVYLLHLNSTQRAALEKVVRPLSEQNSKELYFGIIFLLDSFNDPLKFHQSLVAALGDVQANKQLSRDWVLQNLQSVSHKVRVLESSEDRDEALLTSLKKLQKALTRFLRGGQAKPNSTRSRQFAAELWANRNAALRKFFTLDREQQNAILLGLDASELWYLVSSANSLPYELKREEESLVQALKTSEEERFKHDPTVSRLLGEIEKQKEKVKRLRKEENEVRFEASSSYQNTVSHWFNSWFSAEDEGYSNAGHEEAVRRGQLASAEHRRRRQEAESELAEMEENLSNRVDNLVETSEEVTPSRTALETNQFLQKAVEEFGNWLPDVIDDKTVEQWLSLGDEEREYLIATSSSGRLALLLRKLRKLKSTKEVSAAIERLENFHLPPNIWKLYQKGEISWLLLRTLSPEDLDAEWTRWEAEYLKNLHLDQVQKALWAWLEEHPEAKAKVLSAIEVEKNRILEQLPEEVRGKFSSYFKAQVLWDENGDPLIQFVSTKEFAQTQLAQALNVGVHFHGNHDEGVRATRLVPFATPQNPAQSLAFYSMVGDTQPSRLARDTVWSGGLQSTYDEVKVAVAAVTIPLTLGKLGLAGTLEAMGWGAGFVAGFDGVRQGAENLDAYLKGDELPGYDFERTLHAAGTGGLLGPFIAANPVLLYPIGAFGVASAGREVWDGNYATALVDTLGAAMAFRGAGIARRGPQIQVPTSRGPIIEPVAVEPVSPAVQTPEPFVQLAGQNWAAHLTQKGGLLVTPRGIIFLAPRAGGYEPVAFLPSGGPGGSTGPGALGTVSPGLGPGPGLGPTAANPMAVPRFVPVEWSPPTMSFAPRSVPTSGVETAPHVAPLEVPVVSAPDGLVPAWTLPNVPVTSEWIEKELERVREVRDDVTHVRNIPLTDILPAEFSNELTADRLVELGVPEEFVRSLRRSEESGFQLALEDGVPDTSLEHLPELSRLELSEEDNANILAFLDIKPVPAKGPLIQLSEEGIKKIEQAQASNPNSGVLNGLLVAIRLMQLDATAKKASDERRKQLISEALALRGLTLEELSGWPNKDKQPILSEIIPGVNRTMEEPWDYPEVTAMEAQIAQLLSHVDPYHLSQPVSGSFRGDRDAQLVALYLAQTQMLTSVVSEKLVARREQVEQLRVSAEGLQPRLEQAGVSEQQWKDHVEKGMNLVFENPAQQEQFARELYAVMDKLGFTGEIHFFGTGQSFYSLNPRKLLSPDDFLELARLEEAKAEEYESAGKSNQALAARNRAKKARENAERARKDPERYFDLIPGQSDLDVLIYSPEFARYMMDKGGLPQQLNSGGRPGAPMWNDPSMELMPQELVDFVGKWSALLGSEGQLRPINMHPMVGPGFHEGSQFFSTPVPRPVLQEGN